MWFINSTSLAWLICGSAITLVFFWPHVKEIERAAWVVHYERCAERHQRNTALLDTPMCDRGANELAYRDKVDCSRARDENMWGVTVCTITSRYRDHTLVSFGHHLWHSWYVAAFGVLVTLVVIKRVWDSRTEVKRKREKVFSPSSHFPF